jgi:hypothetical protein
MRSRAGRIMSRDLCGTRASWSDDDGGALVEPADEQEQKLAAELGKGQMPSLLSLTSPGSNNGDDPMARSQQDLVHIARFGGGLDISAKDHTQDNLVQLAQNTAAGKGTLILRDIASKPIGDLVNRDGILRWFDSRIANGLIEGINSLVQAAKATSNPRLVGLRMWASKASMNSESTTWCAPSC